MIELYKKYLKYYKKEVILGPIFKIFEAIFELIVPLIMAKIIDIGIKNQDITFITKQGIILFVLAITGLLSTLVCQYYASRASQGVGTKLRNDLYSKLNNLSIDKIEHMGISKINTTLNSDINQLQQSVAMLIRLTVRAPFIVIGSTFMAFMISKKLGIIFFIVAFLIAITILVIMKLSVKKNKEILESYEEVNEKTLHNLRGARVVRANNYESYEENKFSIIVNKLKKRQISLGITNVLLSPITSIIINIAIILVIYFGAISVNTNATFTQGNVTALSNYLFQIMVAIVVVVNLVLVFSQAISSAYRINYIFSLKNDLTYGNKEIKNGVMEFKNVSFSYGNKQTLNNLNFIITTNSKFGIIGSTASGKTTLANLMTHNLNNQEGIITIDGININEYSKESIKNNICLVMQEIQLLNRSIKDNLSIGIKNVTDEMVTNALKVASAYDFVQKLKNGFNEVLYQGGKNLSTGQRGRINIARSVIRNPKILILDDSLSALDLITEAKIINNLDNMKNMTKIIISQKYQTLRDCDQILVLDKGNIVGLGKHDELLNSCSVYQEIYKSQNKEDIK